MKKTLVKHGNSLALVINKPLLELLNIDKNTKLSISIENRQLVIKPEREKKQVAHAKKIKTIARGILKEYAPVFERLSKS